MFTLGGDIDIDFAIVSLCPNLDARVLVIWYASWTTAKCIDEYIRLSVKASETIEESPPLDPRLLDIVERMLDK